MSEFLIVTRYRTSRYSRPFTCLAHYFSLYHDKITKTLKTFTFNPSAHTRNSLTLSLFIDRIHIANIDNPNLIGAKMISNWVSFHLNVNSRFYYKRHSVLGHVMFQFAVNKQLYIPVWVMVSVFLLPMGTVPVSKHKCLPIILIHISVAGLLLAKCSKRKYHLPLIMYLLYRVSLSTEAPNYCL